MTNEIQLRAVTETDLTIFFAQQCDPIANHMAAFTAKDPADRAAFDAHWARIMADDRVAIQTILGDGQVIGHVVSFEQDGQREVSYWLGRRYWGRGLATQALALFLQQETVRPLYARTAQDNPASLRVLQKCGFKIIGEDKGFANARHAEVTEFILQLT